MQTVSGDELLYWQTRVLGNRRHGCFHPLLSVPLMKAETTAIARQRVRRDVTAGPLFAKRLRLEILIDQYAQK